MKSRTLTTWLLFSLPMLAMLLAVMACLGWNEEVVRLFFREHRFLHPDLKQLLTLVTDWGNAVFYLIYIAIFIKAWRGGDSKSIRYVVTYIVVQLIVALVLVRFAKISIGRPRPGEGIIFEPFSQRGAMHSLPSGHTTEAVGAGLGLAYRWMAPALSLAIGIFVAAIGFSRIYLGKHHPSDVFFGWMLGSVSGYAIHLFAGRDEE